MFPMARLLFRGSNGQAQPSFRHLNIYIESWKHFQIASLGNGQQTCHQNDISPQIAICVLNPVCHLIPIASIPWLLLCSIMKTFNPTIAFCLWDSVKFSGGLSSFYLPLFKILHDPLFYSSMEYSS